MAYDNVSISSVLKRKLKSGKEYNKLIPQVACGRTNLGSGDTFHTTDEMQKWIEEYSFQTKKLAQKLKGQGLSGTVTNVYEFLYNHIQYEQDGALQQLRSPACTWKQRKTGVDCKSYSVFASSVLSNLGIKHFIRQIRQPNFYSEEFTHVYIVIPVDQAIVNYKENTPTYVLDATKHQNTESNYIEKVDVLMELKHIGLNAPQDERTTKIISNFDIFSNHLVEKGIPPEKVNAMRSRVSEFTTNGKDPSFKIVNEGVVIQGKLFTLNFKEEENALGLGFAITGTAALAAGSKLMDMLPADFIGNTFGAIFANGFDLSCWNASYSETKAQEHAAMDIPFFLNDYSGLSKNPNTATYNKFLNGMYGYISNSQNGQKSKYAKCTRKGYALRQDFTKKALAKVKTTLKSSGFNIIQTGNKTGGMDTDGVPSYDGKSFRWGAVSGNDYTYPSVRLEGGSSTPDLTSPTVQPGQPQYQPTTSPTNQNGGGQQQNINSGNNPNTSSGSNTGLIIGGVALASLPLFFMMKKSPASKSKK